MPEKWTGDIVALLHLNKITKSELAAKLDCTPEWVSMILNGKRSPEGAEEKFRTAVKELVKEKRGKK